MDMVRLFVRYSVIRDFHSQFSREIFNIYCQIRCIALRVLQTLEGFWIFLFRQLCEWGRGYANHNTTRSQTASPACHS